MNLLDLAYAGATPWFLLKAATDARFRDRLSERFGRLPAGPTGIWFHGSSVGEVNLIRPLAERLDVPIRVTAFTRAGRERAAQHFPTVSYFPLDFTPFVRRALRVARPLGIVLLELEVWPNFLREADVPVVVINGRMTERSFRRYRCLTGVFGRAFRSIRAATAQNEASAERLRLLGVRDVTVTENLKYHVGLSYRPEVEEAWRRRLGWKGPVIVGGSTHEPEERLLLEAYRRLRRDIPDLHIALAPRHLDRVPEVEKTIEGMGLACYKRSQAASPCEGVFLLDTVGELVSLYSLATVVFVGGTFCSRGGQNMLEPAALGKPILTGPSLSNFADIARTLVDAGGMRIVAEPAGLASAILEVCRSPGDMGERARAVLERGKGALEKGLELIRNHILGGRHES